MNNPVTTISVVSSTDDEKSKDDSVTSTPQSNIIPSHDCGENNVIGLVEDNMDISPSILNCFNDMSGGGEMITLYAENQDEVVPTAVPGISDVPVPHELDAPNVPHVLDTPNVPKDLADTCDVEKSGDQSSERWQLANFQTSLQPARPKAGSDVPSEEPKKKKKRKKLSMTSGGHTTPIFVVHSEK